MFEPHDALRPIYLTDTAHAKLTLTAHRFQMTLDDTASFIFETGRFPVPLPPPNLPRTPRGPLGP